MEKASKHVTPITLELGGKSPAIVDQDCNVPLAAKRMVWGKFTNAGQTCVAPDYVYVHQNIYDSFLKAVKKQIIRLYGKNPLQNDKYVRIVNLTNFDRLQQFLQKSTVTFGGKRDDDTLKIEPSLIEHVSWEDAIMQEEIFGPLLPILPLSTLEEVISILQTKEKPLALYYFGSTRKRKEAVLQTLSFGGGCVNDTLYHLANPQLPFGGVGHSGIGSYHGKYSFETFSHQKSIMEQTTRFDLPIRYPGGKLKKSIAKHVLKN